MRQRLRALKGSQPLECFSLALKHYKLSYATQRSSCSTISVFIAHANSASNPGSGSEHIKHALTTPAYILPTAASSLLSADSMNKLRMEVNDFLLSSGIFELRGRQYAISSSTTPRLYKSSVLVKPLPTSG